MPVTRKPFNLLGLCVVKSDETQLRIGRTRRECKQTGENWDRWGGCVSDGAPAEVPPEFLKPEGSPRDPWHLVCEFVSAIAEQREAKPSFYDGLHAQVVADSVLASDTERPWIDIPEEPV